MIGAQRNSEGEGFDGYDFLLYALLFRHISFRDDARCFVAGLK
jgi:hypothetical protein